jgi:hypothetical protein
LKNLITFVFIILLAFTPRPTKSENDVTDFQKAWQQYAERKEQLMAFFRHYKCPQINFELIDHYLDAADKHQIDWRLLPAISVQESSCLKRYPVHTHNPFGWASARVGFDSLPSTISFVSEKLANGKYYAGKTIDGKLAAYNPNPTYKLKIKALMGQIAKQP